MSYPTNLCPDYLAFYTGYAAALQDLNIGDLVLPFNSADESQAALLELFKKLRNCSRTNVTMRRNILFQ